MAESFVRCSNLVGYHSKNWKSEAEMIEKIANDVLDKLNVTQSKDFDEYVGIEDHMAKINSLLCLESNEVKMIGIWGPSGIGKSIIARALESRVSRHFQGKVFIDMRFISKSMESYSKGNADDINMKLHLQANFLSKILDKEGIKVDHLGTVRDTLKKKKVLIIIDDLDDQVVLEALAGGDEWFGGGSRIIAVTKDMHILRSRGITCVYDVDYPSTYLALQMLCRAAFGKDSPPDGFKELATEVAERVGRLPLGLNIIGSSLRKRDRDYWVNMMPSLRNGLDGKIEKTLRFSYDGLDRKDQKALFRHIACFFNGDEISKIKLMLADSELNVNISLEVLVDKSLIHLIPSYNNTDIVEMHCLVQEMGKEVVRSQSEKPGKREFIMDSKDVCNVLKDRSGSPKVLGISWNLDEIDRVRLREDSFKGMSNLRFLKVYKKSLVRKKEVRWQLPKRLDDFPEELKLLSWQEYPMTRLPSDFCPEYLVELRMPNSKLVKLWEEAEPLTYLKVIDLSESENLEEIPDLSEAENLETLNLYGCSSLVELPSSIKNLNKLILLNMAGCTKLETLPNGTNLESLTHLILNGCSKLKVFPDLSSKIESIIANKTAFEIFPAKLRFDNLVELHMEHITSERLWEGVQPLASLTKIVLSGSVNLKDIPNLSMATSLESLILNGCSSLEEITRASIQNLNKLTLLEMMDCSSLQTLPTDINLESLYRVNLNRCSRLKRFPDISSNVSNLYLNQTAIEEVPPLIGNFSNLEALEMWECKDLIYISPRIFRLKNLEEVFFSHCEKLAEVCWNDCRKEEAEDNNDTCTELSLISFTDCKLNQETFIENSPSKFLILPGVEVPTYFTHRTTANTFTIPLHQSPLSQPPLLNFKACVVVSEVSETVNHQICFIDITVHCRFRNDQGNDSEPAKSMDFSLPMKYDHQIIFDCCFSRDHDNGESKCEQVEIELSLVSTGLRLKGCGIKCR